VIDSESEEVPDFFLPTTLRSRRLQGPAVLPFGDDRQRDVLQECYASACAEVLQLREHGFMAIERVSRDRVGAPSLCRSGTLR